jgi:hypothetical protein
VASLFLVTATILITKIYSGPQAAFDGLHGQTMQVDLVHNGDEGEKDATEFVVS